MSRQPDPHIIAIMRLYNEERWLKKTLESICDFCRGVVVYDNGSTDNTFQICKECDKVLDIKRVNEMEYCNSENDVKVRNILLDMAFEHNPEFILSVDGDEIFQPFAKEILFEELEVLYPEAPVFEFQYLTIWDKPNQYRYDGNHSNIWHKTLMRLESYPKNIRYIDYVNNPGASHIEKIPLSGIDSNTTVRSKVKIFHFGLYDEELRMRKYNLYNKMDPQSHLWDNYIHIISDKGRLSGPNGFEFRQIPEELVVKI